MMTEDGMDADLVRGIASMLDARAQLLANIINAISGIARNLPHIWAGSDADEFISWWNNQHRPALQEAYTSIAGLAQSARNNSKDQDTTSLAARGGSTSNAAQTGVHLLSSSVGVAGTAAAVALPFMNKGSGLANYDDMAGRSLGYVALGIDGGEFVRDYAKSATSDDTMNDQLNVTMDAVTTFSKVDPITGAVMAGVAGGVTLVENADPALTADIYRLDNPGAGVDGVISDDLRRGDVNPIDVVIQVESQEAAAASDLAYQSETAGHAIVSGASRAWRSAL